MSTSLPVVLHSLLLMATDTRERREGMHFAQRPTLLGAQSQRAHNLCRTVAILFTHHMHAYRFGEIFPAHWKAPDTSVTAMLDPFAVNFGGF